MVAEEPDEPAPCTVLDDAATWSASITYASANRERTTRTITIRSISGHFGEPETILATCHFRKQLRSFRLDRIEEMACVITGELIDPFENCRLLHRLGALKIKDKALPHVMKLLTFMARCDGEFHDLEKTALEDVLGRYALRFGGDDEMLETALVETMRLAPSSQDLINSLKTFKRMPEGPRICRFVIDSTAAVIAADGRQADEELGWALEVSDALKQLAGRT